MPSSIIVELNENNAIQNDAGDYKVLLKNPIKLDKGAWRYNSRFKCKYRLLL